MLASTCQGWSWHNGALVVLVAIDTEGVKKKRKACLLGTLASICREGSSLSTLGLVVCTINSDCCHRCPDAVGVKKERKTLAVAAIVVTVTGGAGCGHRHCWGGAGGCHRCCCCCCHWRCGWKKKLTSCHCCCHCHCQCWWWPQLLSSSLLVLAMAVIIAEVAGGCGHYCCCCRCQDAAWKEKRITCCHYCHCRPWQCWPWLLLLLLVATVLDLPSG